MKSATEWIAGEVREVKIAGATWGITGRSHALKPLCSPLERAKLAIDAARIGTFDLDIASNRMVASPLYEELWGFKPGEFSEANEAFLERVHPEDRLEFDSEFAHCVHARRPLSSEFRVVWPDGSMHWLLLRGQFTFDEAGTPLHLRGAGLDVTERKRHEESLLEATRKAEESNSVKSDFLAHLSHEIRTPLTAIIGMAYLAQRAEPGPPLERYLNKIGNAAQALLGIANDVLDISKVEAGKLEIEHTPFVLDNVLNGTLDIVGLSAEQKGIAIVTSVAPGTPRYLVGDPLRLGQILVNLVNNAVKFTAQGEVAVRVEATEVTPFKGLFSFTVSDTGIGMTAEQVSNLFRPFSQADISITRKYGGTGLGLVISKQLCELLGGRLEVTSEAGIGSTFRFTAWMDLAAGTGLR